MFAQIAKNDFVNLNQVVNVFYNDKLNAWVYIDTNQECGEIEDEYIEGFIDIIKSLCK